MKQNPELGLVLSGGGARCIAQLGVLAFMDEIGVRPDFIAGSSGGALVGMLYAAGKSPREILERVQSYSLYKIIGVRLSWKGAGLGTLKGLRKDLEEWTGVERFEDLEMPLHIGVTEMTRGVFELISEGPLFDMLIASCSIPGMFIPVYQDNKIYADGGILRNFPAEHVRHAADTLIGVNVLPVNKIPSDYIQSTYKLSMRTLEISQRSNTLQDLGFCDILIEPRRVAAYGILQINKAEDLFEIGYRAASQHRSELETILGEK